MRKVSFRSFFQSRSKFTLESLIAAAQFLVSIAVEKISNLLNVRLLLIDILISTVFFVILNLLTRTGLWKVIAEETKLRKKGFKTRNGLLNKKYLIKRLVDQGISPLEYEDLPCAGFRLKDRANKETSEMTPKIVTVSENTRISSPYANRVCRIDSCDERNQFTTKEINRHGEDLGIQLTDDPATWITDIKFDNEVNEIKLFRVETDYYSMYALNWHMASKFPRETSFPINITAAKLSSLKKGDFSIFHEIPASLGLEVSCVTKDRKLLLMQRSRNGAASRAKIQQAVSGGYDVNDFNHSDPLFFGARREVQFELGVSDQEIQSLRLRGTLYFVNSNTISLIFSAVLSITSKEAEMKVNSGVAKESFETKRLIIFDERNIYDKGGVLYDFLKKNYNSVSERLIGSLNCLKSSDN